MIMIVILNIRMNLHFVPTRTKPYFRQIVEYLLVKCLSNFSDGTIVKAAATEIIFRT